MKLYVPELGDRLKLSSEWTFDLYHETRNSSLIKHFTGSKYEWKRETDSITVTLPKDTILKVDRVYIRQGASEYSSLSFYAENLPSVIKNPGAFGKPKSARFWAKLTDCNRIEFDIETAAPSTKIKLYFGNIKDVYDGYTYMYNVAGIDNTINEFKREYFVTQRTRAEFNKVLIAVLEHKIEWVQAKPITRLFGVPITVPIWNGTIRNPEYILLTLQGEQLGKWKTLASLKKFAKTYIEKLNN